MNFGEAKRPAPARWAVALAVALVAGFLLLPPVPAGRGGGPPSGSHPAAINIPAQANFTVSTVNYVSSVDGWPLSYSEILPLNYTPARTYPLAIELHGIDTADSTNKSGGYPTPVTNSTADAAVAAGFLLIVINTRTGDGYYVNSNFTGPQAQDVLDAIAHEESIRHIGKLYLYGFSMGSMGAISIALNHRGMFAGVGAVAAFSDDFELQGRLIYSGNSVLEDAGLLPAGNVSPNASSYARGIFAELSPLRYYPQNASGLRFWIAGGALDVFATNNLTMWPYEQANDTVLDSTCLVETSLGEPPSCTVPLAVLHAEDPSNYSYRYVFEPNGFHAYDLLNATDMFAYFNGEEPSGEYWGLFPDPTLHRQPVPLVTLVTEPTGCGSIALNGTLAPAEQTVAIAAGSVPVSFLPCTGTVLGTVTTAGGVSYDPYSGSLSVVDSGSLLVRFTAPAYQVQLAASSICGSILFGGSPESANTVLTVPPGVYLASAEPCAGYTFSSWTASGGVSVSNATSPTTTVNVSGNGELTVSYSKNSPPPNVVAVSVTSAPITCPPIVFGGNLAPAGTVLEVPTGTYNISAPSCAGFDFVAWSASGGLFLGSDVASTSLVVSSAGALTAVYAPLAESGQAVLLVSVTPSGCGAAVEIAGVFYANGSTVVLGLGSYPIATGPCPGYTFQGWGTGGEASVSGATLSVQGNGTLTATFVSSGGSGGGATSGSGTSPGVETEWLSLGAGIGVVAGVGVAYALLRARSRADP